MNCALPAVRSVSSAHRRGVALVITLIMLSVVTITAVAFLAMSRRERLSVSAYGEQIDARYLADTALNRAKGDLLGRMFVSSNRFGYGFAVSTNYRNTNFVLGRYFPATGNYRDLTNVAYSKGNKPNSVFDFDLNRLADRESYAGLLGNLYYDPRPPVFVQTNANTRFPWEFRYYLDLNRNRRFETNGWVTATDFRGDPVKEEGPNGQLRDRLEYQVGDPEWIGVLEHPDVPHSGTNKFIGRFAYLILPTGRSLDLNFIGNSAKTPNVAGAWPVTPANQQLTSSYLRNQGVGSWELNLAGFARALNTNVWRVSALADFRYDVATTVQNTGLAFSDAERVLRFRRNAVTQDNADVFYGYELGATAGASQLEEDLVDTYADGPVLRSLGEVLQPSVQLSADDDKVNQPWSGSDERRRFTDINQLFDGTLGLGGRITGQETSTQTALAFRNAHSNSTYNSYTFYRAIGQLGTDSPDARFESGFHPAYARVFTSATDNNLPPPTYFRRAKLNLNYAHDPNGDQLANAAVPALQRWTPLNWFTNAADRLLLTEFTNGLPIVRSPEIRRRVANDRLRNAPYGFPVYGEVVAPNGFLTNYVYDSQVHRLLQVAANIYDYANAPADDNLEVGGNPVKADNGTNNYFLQAPHVFRPRFYVDDRDIQRKTPVLRIGGYELITNNTGKLTDRWLTPQEALLKAPQGLPGSVEPSTDINVFGIPWVVGAKKGLPNFNEGFWQSRVQVTRRMRLVKPVASTTLPDGQGPFSAAAAGRGVRGQVQYRVTLTNSVGVEALNSYNFKFPVPVTVQVRLTNHYAIYAEFQNSLKKLWPATAADVVANQLVSTHSLAANQWLNAESIGVVTNYVADFILDSASLRAFTPTATNFGWVDVATAAPALTLAVTNQMVFSIITTQNPVRVLDVVSMQSVVYETNILRYFGVQTPGSFQPVRTSGEGSGRGEEMALMWLTNKAGLAGTLGISNQFAVSIGDLRINDQLWRAGRAPGAVFDDRDAAKDGLNYFLHPTNRPGLTAAQMDELRRKYGGTNFQAGYTPSPVVIFTERRQANDPLVHYLKDDLLPGYTAAALAAPSTIPNAYSAEVERNGTRMRQDGSVWPVIWRAAQPNNPLTRWTNAALARIDFRGGTDLASHVTHEYWTPQIRTNPVGKSVRLARVQTASAPWGQTPQLGSSATGGGAKDFSRINLGVKDPQISSPDNWRFLAQSSNAPTALQSLSYPNLGWLGRVHRGTPWQTTYLKSAVVALGQESSLQHAPWLGLFFGEINSWTAWAGNPNTHPINDWKLVDLFTTAPNDNAAHGLLGVNQTGLAAWAAVLSGVPVLDNRVNASDPKPLILGPDSPELAQIVTGYTNQQSGIVTPGLLTTLVTTNALAQGFNVAPVAPGGTFTNLGSILSVPTLSDRAPFLAADNSGSTVMAANVTDEVVERLPQQILSLLRADEPLVTVYAYGQSLKPAPNAFYLRPGNFYGMVTNYVVTGEFATKTLLRFEGTPNAPTTKVEDHRILYQNP